MSLKRPDAANAPVAPSTNPFAAAKENSTGGLSDEDVQSQIAGALGEDDEEDEAAGKKRDLKWLLAIIAVVLVVALLGVAIWFAAKPQNKKIVDDSSTGSSAIGKSDGGSDAANVADNDSFMSELGIPEYYQKPNTEMTEDEKKQASAAAIEAAPANAAMALPSSQSNPDLTSDPAKAFNDDGTINPDYSYITMDNTMPLIYDDLQRLVNPVYGQWTGMQQNDRGSASGSDVNGASEYQNLRDMMSSDVDFTNEETFHSKINLYADWNKDNYGGKYAGKLASDPIVGTVTAFDCDFNVQGAAEDTVTCYGQVTYSGQVPDTEAAKTTAGAAKKVITEDKSIQLDYKVNYGDSNSQRRVLLTSVEQ